MPVLDEAYDVVVHVCVEDIHGYFDQLYCADTNEYMKLMGDLGKWKESHNI